MNKLRFLCINVFFFFFGHTELRKERQEWVHRERTLGFFRKILLCMKHRKEELRKRKNCKVNLTIIIPFGMNWKTMNKPIGC